MTKPPPKLSQFKTLDDLIKFFAAIPAKQWMQGDYKDAAGPGGSARYCAMGHLGVRASDSERDYSVLSKLAGLGVPELVIINDNTAGNPKKNVLTYLRKLRAEQRAAAKAAR